ncbi:MAG TPA: zinc-binding alcohol dehydrogenase [Clostridiaceae bacterium]|nr:zinc-binding alcohol dehydrogenase [Clostridiaceae bacterium]
MVNYRKIIAVEKGKMALEEGVIADPSDNEVQVRAISSVISPGTERAFILALENTKSTFPQSVGYSCSGIVEKVGNSVTEFKVGDYVAGIMHHQSIGNIPVENVVKIPDGVSFDEAAFVRIGVIAMQAVRKAKIELCEGVLVIGMGLIGQTAMQLAKVNGAYPLICADKVESKLKLAKENGADVVVNTENENWIDEVMEATEGKGPQVVIESTGFPLPIVSAFQAARRFGRVILLGSTRGDTTVNFYRDVHKKALTIIGAHISSNPEFESYPNHWTFKDNAKAFLSLIKNRRINE